MSKAPATVYDLIQMQAGTKENATWINEDFEAVVSNVKASAKVTTATLSDIHNPSVTIAATFFGRDCSRLAGNLCHFSGKGMTRTEYKGTQQVTIGDKATVQVVGKAPATPPPAGKASPSPASAAGSSVIHGATVGMAINQACALIKTTVLESPEQPGLSYLQSPAFSKDLWTTASDILRVSGMLEKGKLADSPKHRADPEAQAREEEAKRIAAEKAEAERKAKEEQERREQNLPPAGSDEDVPF